MGTDFFYKTLGTENSVPNVLYAVDYFFRHYDSLSFYLSLCDHDVVHFANQLIGENLIWAASGCDLFFMKNDAVIAVAQGHVEIVDDSQNGDFPFSGQGGQGIGQTAEGPVDDGCQLVFVGRILHAGVHGAEEIIHYHTHQHQEVGFDIDVPNFDSVRYIIGIYPILTFSFLIISKTLAVRTPK